MRKHQWFCESVFWGIKNTKNTRTWFLFKHTKIGIGWRFSYIYCTSTVHLLYIYCTSIVHTHKQPRPMAWAIADGLHCTQLGKSSWPKLLGWMLENCIKRWPRQDTHIHTIPNEKLWENIFSIIFPPGDGQNLVPPTRAWRFTHLTMYPVSYTTSPLLSLFNIKSKRWEGRQASWTNELDSTAIEFIRQEFCCLAMCL